MNKNKEQKAGGNKIGLNRRDAKKDLYLYVMWILCSYVNIIH